MKNCIFISPNYPEGHWRYAEALKNSGWTVLGIGDAGDETFPPFLRANIDDYYRVSDLNNYSEVFRACAYMIWKHGPVERVESVNSFWEDTVLALRKDIIRTTSDPSVFFAETQELMGEKNILSSPLEAKYAPIPSVAVRCDRKTGETVRLTDEDSIGELIFSEGERYRLSPVSYAGGAEVLFIDRRPAAVSAYIYLENAVMGVPLSESQRKLFEDAAAPFCRSDSAIIHVDADVCEATKRGVIKKGELIPAAVSCEAGHEYLVDLMSAEYRKNIRLLWAGNELMSDSLYDQGAGESEALTRSGLGCIVWRKGGAPYKRYHEQVLSRLAPRLYYHNSVLPRDRGRFSDYIYIFSGDSQAELRRDIKFITEPEPARKKPIEPPYPAGSPAYTVYKNSIELLDKGNKQ